MTDIKSKVRSVNKKGYNFFMHCKISDKKMYVKSLIKRDKMSVKKGTIVVDIKNTIIFCTKTVLLCFSLNR